MWGIGSVIWSLIAHIYSEEGPIRGDKEYKDNTSKPLSAQRRINRNVHNAKTTLSGKRFPSAEDYSDEIKNLARACLNWDQDSRPTLSQLLSEADDKLGRRGSKEELRDWEKFELSFSDNVDDFEIGATYDVRRRA